MRFDSAETSEDTRAEQRQAGPDAKIGRMPLPDIDAPAFKAEAHRQSLTVAMGLGEAEDQTFIDSLSDWEDDTTG